MSPNLIRPQSTLTTKVIPSILGDLVAMADESGLVALNFLKPNSTLDDASNKLAKRFETTWTLGDTPFLIEVEGQLGDYFNGKRETFNIRLSIRGTPFQKRVWRALLEIPYGKSMSYSDLAAKLDIKHGQRAVGKANGDNPIAILVPCHRVIRADGDLCGYAGGLWRKQHLLGLESGQISLF